MTSTHPIFHKHGEQWQSWIETNLRKHCSPHSLYERMIGKQWTPEDASLALEHSLSALGRPSQWQCPLPRLNPQAWSQLASDADPHPPTPQVLARLHQPHAWLLGQVLTAQECHDLIAYAQAKGLQPSNVVDGQTGDSVSHHARTSSSVMLTRAETPLIDRIEQRLAKLTQWPIENGEGLQILRYHPEQQYKPHYDWFDPEKAGSSVHLKRGGQRVGTTVMYLQPPLTGGATSFPSVGAQLTAPMGGAVFFQNLRPDGQPEALSLHAGMPVETGEKIVMTYWQRQGPFRSAAA
ncbi:MAG: 2OG-Fe(II) oxygenase [Comamonas sp.]|nr:2OG-Fe(II) oxygenase [Comamonas sp.]